MALLMSTTKLVLSTGVAAFGSLIGAASWYTRDVLAVEADATLLKSTEQDAFVDTFYYKQRLEETPKVKFSPVLLAKSLYFSPLFQPERLILSIARYTLPTENEFDHLPIKTGTQMACWAVQEQGDSHLLMSFPAGHTYLKANYLSETSELEFWFGSNLSTEASVSPIVKAAMPFHSWYSRILCKNIASTLSKYLKRRVDL